MTKEKRLVENISGTSDQMSDDRGYVASVFVQQTDTIVCP